MAAGISTARVIFNVTHLALQCPLSTRKHFFRTAFKYVNMALEVLGQKKNIFFLLRTKRKKRFSGVFYNLTGTILGRTRGGGPAVFKGTSLE